MPEGGRQATALVRRSVLPDVRGVTEPPSRTTRTEREAAGSGVIDVPAMQYLMVDGYGDPNTSQNYADALAALYPVAYELNFASKRDLQRDNVLPPLEALWWASDMAVFTSARDKSRWCWTAMIMTPDWITAVVRRHDDGRGRQE
jgi:hypothetical protein